MLLAITGTSGSNESANSRSPPKPPTMASATDGSPANVVPHDVGQRRVGALDDLDRPPADPAELGVEVRRRGSDRVIAGDAVIHPTDADGLAARRPCCAADVVEHPLVHRRIERRTREQRSCGRCRGGRWGGGWRCGGARRSSGRHRRSGGCRRRLGVRGSDHRIAIGRPSSRVNSTIPPINKQGDATAGHDPLTGADAVPLPAAQPPGRRPAPVAEGRHRRGERSRRPRSRRRSGRGQGAEGRDRSASFHPISLASTIRARLKSDLTVPSGTPRMDATSAMVRSPA